jgi:hypothetical protein
VIRRVVAVDPGKATGIAWMDLGRSTWSTETVEDWREVPYRVKFWGPDQIHVEEFRINASTASKTAAPWSLKLYGALEVLAYDLGIPFTHAPSTVKTIVTDRHLRAAGLWKGRSAHERDALRHLVVALAKMNDPWAVEVLLAKEEDA